jgi:hypothetical protein
VSPETLYVNNRSHGPVYLAEALEKLLAPYHDKYLVAAAAHLYPKTIQNIVSRRPISQATLDKVARALARGKLSPKPYPPRGAESLADRLHRFLLSMAGTIQAAGCLNIDPLVLAKLIYGRRVNRRFRDVASRRLESLEQSSIGSSPVIPPDQPPETAYDSLAECRHAYDMYKTYGTLEAVGHRLNLSRERVRQLINRGVAYGVIPATPHYTEASHPFPFSGREEFLAAYRKTPNLQRMAQDLRISKERLKRFCGSHQITQIELEEIRRLSRQSRPQGPAPVRMPNIVVNM